MTSIDIPRNLDAEKKLLGALIVCPELIAKTLDAVPADAFFSPSHAKIWEVVKSAYARHGNALPDTVADILIERRQLDEVGGFSYLAHLIAIVPSAANLPTWLQIVTDDAKARAIIRLAHGTLAKIDAREITVTEIAQEIRSEADRIAATGSGASAVISLADGMPRLVERLIARQEGSDDPGLMTGFRPIDQHLGGLKPGQLVVLAARPSLGKTALAMNIAAAVATGPRAKAVAVFSLEMTSDELLERLACAAASVAIAGKDGLNRASLTRFCDATYRLASCPIFIDDSPRQTLSQIRLRALEQRETHGITLLIIDYLQLIKGEGLARNANREQEIAGISRGLKALAKELKLPVLVLAQLNRAAEGGERPRLSQLRESGQIEQDADAILFLHRDRKEAQNLDAGTPLETELIIEKNRSGPCGMGKLDFLAEFCRFENPLPQCTPL